MVSIIHFMDGNGNSVLQWIPAESQHKRFKIIYNGEFEMDGKYTLMVQGADRSGNLSGDVQYKIGFEVIRERVKAVTTLTIIYHLSI